MDVLVAVGGQLGTPGHQSSWDWWPLVGIAISLWFVRRVVRIPLGAVALILSFVAGTVYATIVHTWGVVGASAVILVLVAAVSVARGGSRGYPPPRV